MHTWKDVVKLALVGTARMEGMPSSAEAGALAGSEDPVAALMGRLNAETRERALLSRGAILTCCRRAGRLLAQDGRELPAPAEAEEWSRIGSAAALDLDRMLQGEYADALPDWLVAVAAHRRRVPEEQLADLLALGERRKELRSLIAPVVGQRGRWLATHNPDWQYATQRSLFAGEGSVVEGGPLPDAEERERVWQTGDREARLALLEQLRAVEPALATALVAATWAQDPAEERALFLDTFAVGLSLDDEPLLEKALDDRRKEVRQKGQTLLYQLPGSQLIARMMARARPLLTYEASTGLQVALPTVCDKAMQRDGIAPKPLSLANRGERAWWLQQIVSAVPLAWWERWLDLTPAKIVQCNVVDGWQEVLLGAWFQALQRFSTGVQMQPLNREWAEVLLEEWLQKPHTGVTFDSFRLPWHTLLPQSVLEQRLTEILRADLHMLGSNHPMNPQVAQLLSECKQSWGVDLTRAVLASLKFVLPSSNYAGYQVASYLQTYAPLMSLEAAEEIRSLCETASRDPYLVQRLESQYALVQFRNEMLKRIASN